MFDGYDDHYRATARLGKYDRNASADEKRVLLRAVRELATDAAAIVPKSMEIDFVEASGGSGNAVFGAMADYLDKQVSKAVVGQTMTTDEGSSRAQSEIHDEVRIDIRKSDARQLATTINRDLIAPFVAFNWVGTILPVDDEWWATHYPPNGWLCQCRVAQISRREAAALGYDPDKGAPPVKWKTWTNKRTGERVKVPEGIDPGWQGHPGMRRAENTQALLRGNGSKFGELIIR